MSEPPYDFALAGGGISGLALACALVESQRLSPRVLVVDDDVDGHDDRTLSYFSASDRAVDRLTRVAFAKVRFAAPGVRLDLPLIEYRYRSLRGRDYRRDARARLAASGKATLLRGHVERVEDGADGAAIVVAGQAHHARWVFDSRPQAARPATARQDALVQRFVGWEVELEEPFFDPESATLFDFSAPDQGGPVRFHYVLPFSARSALIELVTFGAPARSQDLAGYVSWILGGARYRIVRREGGASLLTPARFERRLGRRVVALGVAGGMLRASTGYALTRILDDTQAIVAALESGQDPLLQGKSRGVYRVFDGVLLRLAAIHAAWLPRVFAALFTRNPVERVLRFLDQRATWRDLIGLVLAAPKVIFLRGLGSWMGMRLGLLRPVHQIERWEGRP
jgi:lycopene beta-cyclase